MNVRKNLANLGSNRRVCQTLEIIDHLNPVLK